MTQGPDMPDVLSEQDIEELIASAREEFAECHAEDCNSYGSGYAAAEIDVWQKVLPTIAADRERIAALESGVDQQAHAIECLTQERDTARANQRTKGTYESCVQCGTCVDNFRILGCCSRAVTCPLHPSSGEPAGE